MTPAVSVLMAVRNGLPWVGRAMDSVLEQRGVDVELVVVDDGSTDETVDLLQPLHAPSVVVLTTPPVGLTRALNLGLRYCRAPLIARLDADDGMLPGRLAAHASYLAEHPDVGLVGSAVREVGADGRWLGIVRFPVTDAEIRHALPRRNPVAHSAVMFRRSVLDAMGGVYGYDESYPVCQDYDLWMRMAQVTKLANLPEVLTIRRRHAGQVSAVRRRDRRRAEARIRWRAVRRGWIPAWGLLWALRAWVASTRG